MIMTTEKSTVNGAAAVAVERNPRTTLIMTTTTMAMIIARAAAAPGDGVAVVRGVGEAERPARVALPAARAPQAHPRGHRPEEPLLHLHLLRRA